MKKEFSLEQKEKRNGKVADVYSFLFYSRLYEMCYPFESCSDIYLLGPRATRFLIDYIKHYPGTISNAILRARRNGIQVEGWEYQKGIKARVFPSTGLVDVIMVLQEECNKLISKIEAEQSLSDFDILNLNRILYANKYCRLVSFFYSPMFFGPTIPWEFEPEDTDPSFQEVFDSEKTI